MEHTKWEIDPIILDYIIIRGDDGFISRRIQCGTEANARRIVKCCNGWDELIRVCKEVASMAGKDWLRGQIKLADAIANAEKA